MLHRLPRSIRRQFSWAFGGRSRSVLILGGARSGKSRYAQCLALGWAKHPIYLATSRIYDDDHRRRIERHRADRGPEWVTVEEHLALDRPALRGKVVVVDCITLWLTNLLVDQSDFDAVSARAEKTLDGLLGRPGTFILVSNEVGQGIHAPTELGRKFTDLQGAMNQYIAHRVETVILMVAGIPRVVKGALPKDAPSSALAGKTPLR